MNVQNGVALGHIVTGGFNMANFKSNRRYENLKRLSTEELEKMLRTAPFLSDSQETSEYYDAIEEVILERETENPTGRLSDLDSSWEEFQQQYASPEGRGMRLYPEEERSEASVLTTKTNRPHAKSLFRKVVPLAAAIAVVFMSMIAVQAAGVDVFGSLARWTEETFHFSGGSETPAAETAHPLVEDETYLAIQAEVDKLDIDIPVVPTWFPDGYELQEIKPSHPDIPDWQSIDCSFLNDDGEYFFLTITKYVEGYDISSVVFEKDGQPVSEYIANEKLFYIMSDMIYKTAAWSDGHIVVSLSGPVTKETLEKTIDSIGG